MQSLVPTKLITAVVVFRSLLGIKFEIKSDKKKRKCRTKITEFVLIFTRKIWPKGTKILSRVLAGNADQWLLMQKIFAAWIKMKFLKGLYSTKKGFKEKSKKEIENKLLQQSKGITDNKKIWKIINPLFR